MSEVRVSASLLSADPLRLLEEAVAAREAGAHLLHLDIMDGHFVPPITFGPSVARGLKEVGLPLDIHLMVDCIDYAVPAFAPYATYLTVHVEAARHLHRVLQQIRDLGCKPGVALNPATPPHFLSYVLDVVDLVLVMTVNPGWGGQKCIDGMAEKVATVKSIVSALSRPVEIEVDGGITDENCDAFVRAGATIAVSGSYLFSATDMKVALSALTKVSPR